MLSIENDGQRHWSTRYSNRVEAVCIGYPNYYDSRDTKFYHSPKCRKRISVPVGRLKLYRASDDGESVFVNSTEKTYRCVNCANAISIVRKREKRVKEFMT